MSTQDELLEAIGKLFRPIKEAVEITKAQVSMLKNKQEVIYMRMHSLQDQQTVLNDKFDDLDEKVTGLEKKMATKDDLKSLATKKDLARLEGKVDYLKGGIQFLMKNAEDEGDLTEKRLKRVADKLNLPAIS